MIDTIRSLHADGKSASEIASKLGISYTAVRENCKRLGLPPPIDTTSRQVKWTSEEEAKLSPFLEKVLSREKSIELLPSRSENSVTKKLYKLRRDAGLSPWPARRRGHWTDEEDDYLRQHMKQNSLSRADVAIKLGRTEIAVFNRVKVLRKRIRQAASISQVSSTEQE